MWWEYAYACEDGQYLYSDTETEIWFLGMSESAVNMFNPASAKGLQRYALTTYILSQQTHMGYVYGNVLSKRPPASRRGMSESAINKLYPALLKVLQRYALTTYAQRRHNIASM